MPEIALIGAGTMGSAIGSRLLEQGCALTFFDVAKDAGPDPGGTGRQAGAVPGRGGARCAVYPDQPQQRGYCRGSACSAAGRHCGRRRSRQAADRHVEHRSGPHPASWPRGSSDPIAAWAGSMLPCPAVHQQRAWATLTLMLGGAADIARADPVLRCSLLAAHISAPRARGRRSSWSTSSCARPISSPSPKRCVLPRQRHRRHADPRCAGRWTGGFGDPAGVYGQDGAA